MFNFAETVMYNKIMMLNRIISTAASPYTTMLIQQGMNANQVVYNTRVRELKIAWRPKLVRKGQQSFLFTAISLYNQTKIMGKMISKEDFKGEIKQIVKSWRK